MRQLEVGERAALVEAVLLLHGEAMPLEQVGARATLPVGKRAALVLLLHEVAPLLEQVGARATLVEALMLHGGSCCGSRWARAPRWRWASAPR